MQVLVEINIERYFFFITLAFYYVFTCLLIYWQFLLCHSLLHLQQFEDTVKSSLPSSLLFVKLNSFVHLDLSHFLNFMSFHYFPRSLKSNTIFNGGIIFYWIGASVCTLSFRH